MSEHGMSSGVSAGTAPIAAASFEASDRHLRRAIPFQSLLFLSMGAIIGSGWLFGSLKAAAVAGPAAVISWAVGGIFVICISLAWAEIASMIPRTGAIVRYPSLAHGAYTGWIMGWAYWLSAASVPTIEAEAVVTYLGGRWPQADFVAKVQGQQVLAWPNGILFGIGLMLLFFVLNFFGVRLLSEWNRWFTWWKIVVPTLTFCFLFAAFKGTNYTGLGGFAPMGVAPIFQALATSGVIFAYLGFRQALDYGGEARNPQRDIPLATVGSIVIAMVIYVLLQIAFLGALNWHAAGVQPGQWAKLAESPWAAGPLYNALVAANIGALGAFGTVLLIDAGVSPSGTGWIYLGTSTRVFYGLSVPGWLPRVFQRMNPWGIPWPSVVGALVVGCVFFIPAPSWYILVGFITSTTVLTYIMGGVTLPVLRRLAPDMPRPFRLGAAWFWAPVGFLAALMIVYWSGFSTLDNVFAAVMVGLPLFAWFFAWTRGWADRRVLGPLGAVFLAAWIYVNHMGGWTLNAGSKVLPGSWPFPAYDIAFSASVLFFCGVLWAVCNQEGRHHVQRSAWLIFLILATFPLSYWGEYGPLTSPALGFPWGTLVEVGIGLLAYVWGALSGFATEELKEIVSAAGHRLGSEPLPLLPRALSPSRPSTG